MSSVVDNDTRRAKQVTAAKKKLNQYRAARTTPSPDPLLVSPSSPTGSAAVLNTSTAENTLTLPRRVPSQTKPSLADAFDPPPPPAVSDVADHDESVSTPPKRHARLASKHHRQKSSMSWPPATGPLATRQSVVGFFDLPSLEHTDASSSASSSTKPLDSENSDRLPREIVTTPATPPSERGLGHDDEEHFPMAKARMNSFSFGSKASAPLLPSLPLRRPSPDPSRPHSHHSDLRSSHEEQSRLEGEERSPRARRRHSHNRSASISLPNLKLGARPTSLGVTSPAFPSTPSTPSTADSISHHITPKTGNRLRFEPSDKEKEESRRRALDKLTGGERREEPARSIVLPALDDDDDELSTFSSRPPSDALTSTASSSRPSSFTFPSATSSFNGSAGVFPLSWASGLDDTDRWSFGQRFDHPREEAPGFGFDLGSGPKTSSVLINSNLGVLAEEDETESETLDVETDDAVSPVAQQTRSPAISTPSAPTPSRLRELHLVSSASTASSSRRSSNPEALQAFARAAAAAEPSPTKGYGNVGRGRPSPLAGDSKTGGSNRPASMNSLIGRRPLLARSSISYKKDDSGSGSSRGAMSPPSVTNDLVTSPTSASFPLGDWSSFRNSNRACPRPRSAIIGGTSGRVLGEVDEGDESSEFRSFDMRDDSGLSEASRDSFDGHWGRRRDSRERIDAEMERDALREDVDLWRKRCRNLEDRLEAERRETAVLRDRVRKLGDRLLIVSSATDFASPTEEHEAAQSRVISEMRDQLFALTSALQQERNEKLQAQARASELQTTLDEGKTPHVSPLSLPSTPKSRSHLSLTNVATPPEAKYADADYADDEPHHPREPDHPTDPNWTRLRGWGFPQGPVETSKENKRESFFGLSRPRAVNAPPNEGQGLGLDWLNSPLEPGFDLPPFQVNDGNRQFVETRRPRPVGVHYTPERQTQTQPQSTPPNPTTSPLAFLTGYLPLPRRGPVQVPRVMITPSSVSPKKPLKHLEHYGSFVVPGCEVDFRYTCTACEGEVIDL